MSVLRVYPGHRGSSDIEHGLSAYTVDNPLDYLSIQAHKPCSFILLAQKGSSQQNKICDTNDKAMLHCKSNVQTCVIS